MIDIESLTTAELVSEYKECLKWVRKQKDKDSPVILSTGDYMLDLRYEYHFRTGKSIGQGGEVIDTKIIKEKMIKAVRGEGRAPRLKVMAEYIREQFPKLFVSFEEVYSKNGRRKGYKLSVFMGGRKLPVIYHNTLKYGNNTHVARKILNLELEEAKWEQ